MLHFLHLLKSILYTILIVGIPTLIMTGGNVPPALFKHPAYQFFILLVFAYTAAPVLSDFAGNHVGRSLFFPNRANIDHPTISHIISLRKKGFYKEAMEELRMLTDLHPEELEPYKMLLHLTAHELPDRRLFDMIYRKGMFNLQTEELKNNLRRYRDDHIQEKEKSEEEWHDCHMENISPEESLPTQQFYANKKHKRQTPAESITDLQSGTLPSRPIEKPEKKRAVLPEIYAGEKEEISEPKKPSIFVVNSVDRDDPDEPEGTIITMDKDDYKPRPQQNTYVFRRSPKKRRRV